MTDMTSPAITSRLRHAAARTDLRTELRLRPKLDMSPAGIARRLERVEDLRRMCLALVAIGARAFARR